MKVSLLNQTPIQLPGLLRKTTTQAMLVLGLLFLATNLIWAEGSKDFVTYPGYRMFLDTRDPQQLKVYANAGDSINVGSSHVGIQGGFIKVYRPDGTLAATFDNTGASTGLGIINNNTQELAGPTGGGSTNGTGYIPGVVRVPAGQSGIWTVVFDYPNYVNTTFTNILNNAPWSRALNQPNTARVVLAWDVTITEGGAGNQGGTVREGRLYSNEHISLINGNGVTTSPVFYVLTDDGFLYQVNINDADPFRFPISSNSLGLVNGLGQPIYKSKPETAFTRSDNSSAWLPNNLYLYEPQAEDDPNLELINNKIFFNLPDNTMPSTATVTDIFRSNVHTTWLYNTAQNQDINNYFVIGANPGGGPCAAGTFQFGKGAYFVFDTDAGGSVTVQIDINNNGIFNDPVDLTLSDALSPGLDSLYWDGFDGNGVAIPIQDDFILNYQGFVRFGEIHIALTDVENIHNATSTAGVTFQRLVPLIPAPTNQFYYDHSDVQGPISGSPAPGNPPLPTTIPYDYTNNAGNDRYIDQWTFIQAPFSNVDTFDIIIDCTCTSTTTPALTGTGAGDVCDGEDLVMTATNSVAGLGNLIYNWSGPAGFSSADTIADNATSTVTVNDVTAANAGTYQVIAQTLTGCADTISLVVVVNPTPNAGAIAGGGSFCAGETVTLTATNIVPGISTVTYLWTGPGVPSSQATGTVAGNQPITLTLTNAQPSAAGTYSLTLTSELDCVSNPISTNITITPTPTLTAVSGGGSYCVDDDVTLIATNSAVGVGTMTCTWTGPNGLNSPQTVNEGDQITFPLTNISNTLEGTYTLVCVSAGCSSNPVTFDVVVNAIPEINAISPNGAFCEGAAVTLTALNVGLGTGPINYTWTGPATSNNPLFPFSPPAPAPEPGPFEVTIPSLTLADAGTYILVLETLGGCQSVPQSVNISVQPSPNITVTGGGDACIGQDVTLSATNTTTGVGTISYTWTDAGGNLLGNGNIGANAVCELVLNDVTVANNGTYTITKTIDATGCSSSETVSLNVLPGLNIVNLTPDGTFCEFENITLSAANTVSAGLVSYTWTGPDGTVITVNDVDSFGPFTTTITEATPAHTGVWTLEVTSASGCNATVSVNIVVEAGVRLVSVTGGGDYCDGAPLALNGIGEGSATSVDYTWTDPAGNIIANGNTTAAGPFPATGGSNLDGVYTLNVVAVGSGCADSAQVTVNYKDLPLAIVLNNDTTLCALDTLEICGQAVAANLGDFSYTWTTPTGQIISGNATGAAPFCRTILPMQTYGEGAYTLVVTVDGCTSLPDSFNVTLNPNPVISTPTGGGTYCEGETAEICFTNTNPEVVGFFYTCILPDGTQTSGQTNTNETICLQITTSGTICCSLESFDGCVSSIACVDVVFEPSAELEVPTTLTVCANDTLQLSGTNSLACSGTISYLWNGPNGFTFGGVAPCAGPFTASVLTPVSGEYCLIAPLSSNCPDTACVTVIVNPVPVVNGGTISGGGEFCAGEQTTLVATVSISDNTPISYQWCLDDVPMAGQSGTVPSGTTVQLDLGVLETGESGEYCLKLTSSNGCQNIPPTCTTVTVNPAPEIITATGGGTFCEGLDVVLNGSGVAGLGNVTYMWVGPNNFVFNGGPVPSAGPFPVTIPNIPQAGEGEYSLIVKLGDCSDTAKVIVIVNPKPIITILSGNGAFCEGEKLNVSFEVDPNGAASVEWTLDCTSFDTSGTVTTATVIDVMLMPDGDEMCTIMASSDQGCEADPMEIQATEQQIADPTISANGTPGPGSAVLCEGDDLVLTSTAQTGTNVTYEWFKDGVLIGTTTVPTFPVNPPMPGSYTVTVTVDGCTATSAPVVVTDPTAPVANDDEYTSDTQSPVNGNVLTNDETSSGVIITVEQPSSGSVVVNADGTFTYTPDNPAQSPVTFNYTICLEACPEECDEATVTITYILDCVPPNIITPDDSPGVNDNFHIDCLGGTPGDTPPASLINNRLRIFNRWGDEIYVAEPYTNEWKGTYGDDEKPLPAGTYFYLFELDKNGGDSKENILSGYVKVVR